MRQTRIAWIGRVALGVALAGCGGGNGDARDFFSPGDFTVGVTSGSLTDTTRDDRTLAVEVWYPAESKGAASAVLDFDSRDSIFTPSKGMYGKLVAARYDDDEVMFAPEVGQASSPVVNSPYSALVRIDRAATMEMMAATVVAIKAIL